MALVSHVLRVKRAIQDACGLSAITDADAGQQQTALDALNSAVQDISTNAPSSWHRDEEFGAYIRAPQTISLTGLSQGAKTVTWAGIGSNTWANGCAIIIGGDPVINRIQRTASGYQLLHPYIGSSSTANATLYNDIVAAPADFLRFKGDLALIGYNRIPIVSNENQLGNNQQDGSPQFIGQPTLARLISRYNSDLGRAPHLKFNALPSIAMRISASYFARPMDVASWSVERYDLVPMDYVESVLIPITLQKLSEISSMVSESRLQGIAAAAESARLILEKIGDAEGDTSPGLIKTEMW
jgi:hypothetical protein